VKRSPGPDIRQAQTIGRRREGGKMVDGWIPTLHLLIIESPTAIHMYSNDIMLHRFFIT
jgi:hypothetical protein